VPGQHTNAACSDVSITSSERSSKSIDDIVVKSRKTDHPVRNLEQTFARLRSYRIKLNPEKCVFGIPKGKLLSFIVSEQGIKANPKKIVAIWNLGSITNRLREQGMPLYKLLKKSDQFRWTDETQEAFD
jgi:hypothetical protein